MCRIYVCNSQVHFMANLCKANAGGKLMGKSKNVKDISIAWENFKKSLNYKGFMV